MLNTVMGAIGMAIIFSSITAVSGLDNGVARTPPMGWLSWAKYTCQTDCAAHPTACINEKLYMDMGDRLASDGWKELGYVQVNIDDCWSAKNRSSDGQLMADPKRFPHGIRGLADYLHAKGLKLGIYADFGNKTCAGYPGSEYHLKEDADTFAEWGIDMLKLDGCKSYLKDMAAGWPDMGMYLNQTGREIIYSCSWPDAVRHFNVTPDYPNIAKHCNLWRNFIDISISWKSVDSIIQHYAANQELFSVVQGPGAWNDPDMLVIGNRRLTEDQEKTQMSMWAIFAAPLLMSNDLRSIPETSKQILQNKAIVAVNQDKMGMFGKRISQDKNIERYMKSIMPVGSRAIVIRQMGGTQPVSDSFILSTIGLTGSCYEVTELFSKKSYGKMKSSDTFRANISPDGAIFLTATVCTTRDYKVESIM